jgi:hypothetical protein
LETAEVVHKAVRRSPDWLWPAAAALGLLLVVRHLLNSGSWLDEYWQLWVSGAPAAQLWARLAADSNPPWFNLFARAILLVTSGAILPARLLSLFAAIAALAVGLWRMTGLDSVLRWRILLLILASGGAVGMTDLAASFRAYPWLLVLAGLQAALLAALALRRPVPPILLAIVTAGSIAIHYVHAAGAIAIALASLALAWRNDHRALRATLIGLVLGVALDLTTGLIQLPQWRANYDVNWIGQNGGGGAFGMLDAVAYNFLTRNLVAAALLAVGLIAGRSKAALMVLAPIPIAFVAWLVLDSITPVLLPRYLASVTALLATAAAVAWWELALAPAANAAIALLAALQPLASSFIRPPLAGWESGARVAAQATRACPGSPLYGVSPWRFRDQPDSKAERFEQPVVALAYREVSREFGLHPQFVGGPTAIQPGRCPAILWIEAAHNIERVPLDVILRRAQLRLPSRAQARVLPTPNGAVLLISPEDRLQPRP